MPDQWNLKTQTGIKPDSTPDLSFGYVHKETEYGLGRLPPSIPTIVKPFTEEAENISIEQVCHNKNGKFAQLLKAGEFEINSMTAGILKGIAVGIVVGVTLGLVFKKVLKW